MKFEASDLGDSVFYFLFGSVLTNDPPLGLPVSLVSGLSESLV